MSEFIPVDMEKWNRADLYRHYTQVWPATLMTFNVQADVTETVRYVKEKGIKLAPALYYLAIRAFVEQQNFRMGIKDDRLGSWTSLCPLYPVLNGDKNITFHSAKWHDAFDEYYEAYICEQRENAGCTKAVCGEIPENFVLISILPFMSFDSCGFSLKNAKGYLSPALFMGKYTETEGHLMMPLSLSINHAVADGYHVQLFFERFGEMLRSPQTYLED